jgi:hypothetical protein
LISSIEIHSDAFDFSIGHSFYHREDAGWVGENNDFLGFCTVDGISMIQLSLLYSQLIFHYCNGSFVSLILSLIV